MDDSAFIAAIKASPDDDSVRLVYADWLDEHDRPTEAARIRHQIATGEEASEQRWIESLDILYTLTHRRGLAEVVRIHPGFWSPALPDFFVLYPNLRHVTFTVWPSTYMVRSRYNQLRKWLRKQKVPADAWPSFRWLEPDTLEMAYRLDWPGLTFTFPSALDNAPPVPRSWRHGVNPAPEGFAAS